ncbi:MAG: DEAD/DEAH box helicase, partial [Clostridium sp.]
WESEFRKFAPTLNIALVNEDKEKREEIITNYREYDVLITTYNLQRMDKELYEMCVFDNIIIDEAQNIKNASSQSAIAIKDIKGKNRFALTGTPIENSLMELWSIFDFIMPGYLYDKKDFETRYFRRLEEEEFILKEVKALINPFILRRKKKNVITELPDKIEKKIIVKMTKEQESTYAAYSSFIKELIAKKVKDDEFSKNKIEILSYITKLRQLALDPSIVMDEYDGGSGKLEGVIEILNECIEEGHKVLLFSQFTSALQKVQFLCEKNKITSYYLDGKTSAKKRLELVNSFNSDNTNVFLISLKAGGAGLNLTSADVVIHLDPWWNPAVEDQATDRAHRIGQDNVVEVIKLISKDTIEEKVINLQDKKKEVIEKVLDDNSFDNILSALTDEDILHLIE